MIRALAILCTLALASSCVATPAQLRRLADAQERLEETVAGAPGYVATSGIVAIGMGLLNLWRVNRRSLGGSGAPQVVADEPAHGRRRRGRRKDDLAPQAA